MMKKGSRITFYGTAKNEGLSGDESKALFSYEI